MALTPDQLERYARQIQMPGFGEAAQEKLLSSHALVTRVGGLGGPACFALAGAGIGKLTVVHSGKLESPDLNRQVLMRGDSIGRDRSPQAEETLKRFRPDLEVRAVDTPLAEGNVDELLADVDIVLDCTPDFEERHCLNAACVRRGLPMIEAAMDDTVGMLTTVLPGKTPCLACIWPESPPEWKIYGFPVIGAVSGALGNLAAMEAVKVLTGFGEPLAGRLLRYDLRSMRFDRYTVRRNPDCPVCGA